jgi:hypothetical protein
VSLPIAILLVLVAALVVFVVSAPIRHASRATEQPADSEDGPPHHDRSPLEQDELEAAREAKYREIRDTELDFRTGKLSSADFETIDAELRSEALDILDRLEIHGQEQRPSDEEQPDVPNADMPDDEQEL